MAIENMQTGKDHYRTVLEGKALVHGISEGRVLGSSTSLSFWGGVDPETGDIIDHHHPLTGENLSGTILAIPSSRGSCSGSGVLLQLLLNDRNPTALVFEREELTLTLGVIIASEIFGKSMPIVLLEPRDFCTILETPWASIAGGRIDCMSQQALPYVAQRLNLYSEVSTEPDIPTNFDLTPFDRHALDGSLGKAAQVAARVIMKMAIIQGATELIDITQAHIDGCIYTGPASLRFAQQLCTWGAKVRVPTTLNSISIDRRRWQAQGVDASFSDPAGQLADAYLEMGASPTYTCAPYLLEDSVPRQGEQIIWAESNAVVYANSVLGARTIKCPDFLDICVAMTGRAPNTGCHVTANRQAQIHIVLSPILESLGDKSADYDALYPILGHVIGDIAENRIPIITGLEKAKIDDDDLKAFSAAFATTSSAPMFHIAGITPEALKTQDLTLHLSNASSMEPMVVTHEHLITAWRQFNRAQGSQVNLVSFGNPHFSYAEIVKLAGLCHERTKNPEVAIMVTCGRETYSKAYKDGHISALEAFGVQIITDTCWCMITEPVIPLNAKVIMTNSAKYAHYGKGLTGRQMRFGSLRQCFEAACCGYSSHELPSWLQSPVQ